MDGYAKDQDLSYDPKYNNLDSGTVSLLKKKGTSLFINDLQNETTIEDLTVSSVDVLSYYLMENDSEMAKLDFQDSYANYLRALNINQEGDYAYRVAGASMLSNYIQNSFNETKESDNSNMNNWISRTELELRYNDSDQLEYSILTVQPLRQTVDKKHTLFSQFSLTQAIDEDYKTSDGVKKDERVTLNSGIGYRKLLLNNKLLAGLNGFYDYVFDWGHQRVSVGAELKSSVFDIYLNKYMGILSQKRENNSPEDVLDGMDLILLAQIPYVEWAKLRLKYYNWSGSGVLRSDSGMEAYDTDVTGISTGFEFTLLSNLIMSTGMSKLTDDSGGSDPLYYINFRAKFGTQKNVAALFSGDRAVFSDKPFDYEKDMADHTLDKVRRTNKVVVKKMLSVGVYSY